MTVKKLADQWAIYDPKSKGWLGTFFMDNQNGILCVYSDYGNYAYSWTHRGGETLREFLIDCDRGYVSMKFSYGMPKHLYFEESIEKIKKDLLMVRREEGHKCKQNMVHGKYIVRELFDELTDFGNEFLTHDSGAFFARFEDTTVFKVIYSGCYESVPVVQGHAPDLVQFMERVWPLFIEECKKEKEEKQKLASLAPPEEVL